MSLRIAITCPTCIGRTLTGATCGACHGVGHLLHTIEELTPDQVHLLRARLAALPPHPEATLSIEDTRANLTKLLTGRRIESISFPAADNHTLHLHSGRSHIATLAIVRDCYGLNALPLPDPGPLAQGSPPLSQ